MINSHQKGTNFLFSSSRSVTQQISSEPTIHMQASKVSSSDSTHYQTLQQSYNSKDIDQNKESSNSMSNNNKEHLLYHKRILRFTEGSRILSNYKRCIPAKTMNADGDTELNESQGILLNSGSTNASRTDKKYNSKELSFEINADTYNMEKHQEFSGERNGSYHQEEGSPNSRATFGSRGSNEALKTRKRNNCLTIKINLIY